MPLVTEFETVVTDAPHVNEVGFNAAGGVIVIRYRPAKLTVPVAVAVTTADRNAVGFHVAVGISASDGKHRICTRIRRCRECYRSVSAIV